MVCERVTAASLQGRYIFGNVDKQCIHHQGVFCRQAVNARVAASFAGLQQCVSDIWCLAVSSFAILERTKRYHKLYWHSYTDICHMVKKT